MFKACGQTGWTSLYLHWLF